MDDARVVINLKEGIIELQGPVEFVRHYLDTYQSAIGELQGLPKGVAASPKKEKRLSRKRKGALSAKAARGKRGSCAVAIRSYLEIGFFDEPRSTGEVRQDLNEAGLTFTDNVIRASLKKLSETGSLQRVGRGRAVRYHRH